MSQPSSLRLAEFLLEGNRHLETFEVDPLDFRAADVLTRALEAFGCTVVADEFSSRLTVHCPAGL